MNIKIALPLLMVLFVFNISSAQKVVYIDENMQEIDSTTYFNKCKHIILKCLIYKTNKLKINKVLFKYKFGNTNKKTVKQIRDFAIEQTGRNIDTSQNLLIYFHDTLYSFEARINTLKYFEQRDSIVVKYTTKKLFDKHTYQSRKKIRKRETTLQKNYNTALLHFYNFDFDAAKNPPQPYLIKDTGFIKNTFFEAIYNYGYVILKPDGRYFLSGGNFGKKNLNLLLKNDD